jgi:hypothetical protein
MSRKRLLITLAAAVCAVLAIVIVSAIIVGVWLMRSSKSKATSVPNAIGTPKGSPTKKAIGPAGGSISSPDGRITVNVPQQAVSEAVDFSIQPLTNMAPGGLGDAYRLEPNGQTFSVPVNLTFKFADEEVAGTEPEALAIAYQDNVGVWRTSLPEIDKQKKSYTVSTTHFSDWAGTATLRGAEDLKRLRGLRIEPKTQTIRPGKSTYVELVGCDQLDRIRDKIGRIFAYLDVGCGGFTFYGKGEVDGHGMPVPLWWRTSLGTIETGKYKVKYTPPMISHHAVASVMLPAETADWSAGLWATIYIEPAYKVSGQNGPVVYSGTICSLEAPFKVTVTYLMMSYEIMFVPSAIDVDFKPNKVFHTSDTPPYVTGYFTYSVTRGLLHMSGKGTYRVNGENTDHPQIACRESSEAHGPMGIGGAGKGFATIQLTPLESSECDGK